MQHPPEPGEQVDRRRPVDREAGDVGVPPGPPGVQVGDGRRQLSRVVAVRLGDHVRAARALAQPLQSLGPAVPQHVVDRQVEDLGHLQRRQAVPYRVHQARHHVVGGLPASRFPIE